MIVPELTARSIEMFENAKPAEIDTIRSDTPLSLSLFENWCKDHFVTSNCYIARMFDVSACIYNTSGDVVATTVDLWCFACQPRIIYAIDITDGEYSRNSIVGVYQIQRQQ